MKLNEKMYNHVESIATKLEEEWAFGGTVDEMVEALKKHVPGIKVSVDETEPGTDDWEVFGTFEHDGDTYHVSATIESFQQCKPPT